MFNVVAKITLISIFLPLVDPETTSPSTDQEIVFRVVNGVPAKLGTIPYQISLKARKNRHQYANFCGGSIIAENKILSAAHCFEAEGNVCQKACHKVQMKNLRRVYAVAGTLSNVGRYVKDGESSEQWRKIANAFIPRDYWFPKNDILIAFTDAPYVFNDNVKILPIASKNLDYGSVDCLASGYGRINEWMLSDKLLWAKLRLIPASTCSIIHGRSMNAFICTASDATNVLQGDSGGPLVCRNTGDPNDKGQGVIVGVVSGAVVKKRGYNTFFTRVAAYQNFVNGNKAPIILPVLYVFWLSLIIINFI